MDKKLKSLQMINLDLILMIVVGYIGYISEKQEEKPYVMELIRISKRIYTTANFVFYAIADGLFVVQTRYCRNAHKKAKIYAVDILRR